MIPYTLADKLRYLLRDVSGIRHDWAKIHGIDAAVNMIDVLMVKMDEIIELEEHLSKLQARELRQYREDNL